MRRVRPCGPFWGLLDDFGDRLSEWLWDITFEAHKNIHRDGTEVPLMSLVLSDYVSDRTYISYFDKTSSACRLTPSPLMTNSPSQAQVYSYLLLAWRGGETNASRWMPLLRMLRRVGGRRLLA
jgi:hypothetical protein